MIDSVQIHLFYPLLFIFLIVVVVTIGLVVKGKSSDKKDTFIFAKSNDNAKEVTLSVSDKMAKMHDNVIKVDFTSTHEKELDQLERGLKKLEQSINDLNEKVDILIQRIVELECND